jgi:hypothetical protein
VKNGVTSKRLISGDLGDGRGNTPPTRPTPPYCPIGASGAKGLIWRGSAVPLALLLGLALFTACASSRPPQVEIPTFPPLPAVHFQSQPDGGLCIDQENAIRLRQREELHQAREQTLLELLRAMGAQEPRSQSPPPSQQP